MPPKLQAIFQRYGGILRRLIRRSLIRVLSAGFVAQAAPGPEAQLGIWLFFRALGLTFLFAFLSLWPQILGLIGARGVLPVTPFLRAVSKQVGWERVVLLPSLFWLGCGDNALHLVCGLGIVCSILLLFGVLEIVAIIGAWLCYLSFVSVGRDFMGFQWDSLLLETALWSLPLALYRPSLRLRLNPVVRVGRWLLFWLLLRFMFAAGWAKLASGDPCWRDLTALDYHFFTQPLPSPIGYYAHQLPSVVKRSLTFCMFVIELVVPFAVFWPRARCWAALLLIALQAGIALTGSYGFFNLLSVVLAIPLLPDSWIRRLLPRLLLSRLQPETPISGAPAEPSAEPVDDAARSAVAPARKEVAAAVVRGILCTVLFGLSLVQVLLMFLPEERLPGWALQGLEYSSVVHAANRYGLFAVMTKERPELVVEGSLDGVNWVPYRFKYKPVDVDQRPRFNAPHQPRLDWQMWFAALRPHRRGGWFDGLCIRLLQGSPDVLWLLAEDPFQGRKPKQVRATLYQYEFTTLHERRQTGAYYKRHDPQLYLDPVSLPDK